MQTPSTTTEERVLILLDEMASTACEHQNIGGPRRYWCLTFSMYGRDDGCHAEQARDLAAELRQKT